MLKAWRTIRPQHRVVGFIPNRDLEMPATAGWARGVAANKGHATVFAKLKRFEMWTVC